MAASKFNRTPRRVRNDGGRRHAGFTLIEVLVTIVIVTMGLLGLAGMQTYFQTADFESYQRAQAIVLANDLFDRMNANRTAADCYAFSGATGTSPYLGTDGAGHLGTIACTSGAASPEAIARADADLREWDALLKGASEAQAGNRIGAMVGARGCVHFDPVAKEYTIIVVWQGLVDTFDVPQSCANGLYGADTKRRAVWVPVRMADLL